MLLDSSKPLATAYRLKLSFSRLMRSENREEARQLLKRWILEAQYEDLKAFEVCTRTFTNWSNETLSYFDHPFTNGYTEGANNKIKVIKRNAFGIKKFRHLRNRILHAFSA